MAITSKEAETMVVKNGCPEEIIIPADDFVTLYGVYRSVNRDTGGSFVLVLNTKVRPKGLSVVPSVDLGDSKTSVFEGE